MMTQEEFMDVMALRRQKWTITAIAEAVGRHPATVSGWLKQGGPPAGRVCHDLLVDEHWAARVLELLVANPQLLGTSVFRLLEAEGFGGSYPTLVRHLREVRGVRHRKEPPVSVPIETAPGEEFQFDWSDCRDWGAAWGLGDLHCFGAILSWSRHLFWWFAPSVDRPHTFEGLVRFFEDVGGVAGIGRTDRMGALGRSKGRTFHYAKEALEFASFHGFAFKVCPSGDAKRKGKIERPFRELKEALLAELVAVGPGSLDELNRRARAWLDRVVHPRPHRTTGVAPAIRLADERSLLVPVPRVRFDTARRQPRHVGIPVPLVEVDGVAYSAPPELAGTMVEIRVPVDQGLIELRSHGLLVATHQVAPPGSAPVWDPAHRRAAEAIALAPHGSRRLVAVPDPEPDPEPEPGLDLGDGDYDVDEPDLGSYAPQEFGQVLGHGCGCGGGA
jgi:transposase